MPNVKHLMVALLGFMTVQAHSAPLKECSGLYMGKTYYIGDSKWSPPSEIRIVGIDKEEGKLTIEYTAGQSREKSNLEFESCQVFKDAMREKGARNSK